MRIRKFLRYIKLFKKIIEHMSRYLSLAYPNYRIKKKNRGREKTYIKKKILNKFINKSSNNMNKKKITS